MLDRRLRPASAFLTLWLGTLLLGGCAASNVAIVPALTPESSLNPGEGLVIVQVADTTPTGRFYPVNQVTFAPKDVNAQEDGKLPRVLAVDGYGRSTKLFVAALPAERYSISSLRSYYSFGDSWFSRFYPAGVDLGTFTVSAGEVTDLGTLAVFINRRGQDYTYESTRVAANGHGLAFARQRFQALAATGRLENPSGWELDGNELSRANAYQRATARQIVFGQPHVQPDGTALAYPAPLGMIIKRDSQRQWSREAFHEDVALTLLTDVDGETVVVTELNDIYRRASEQDPWLECSEPPTTGRIAFLDSHPAAGIYAVTENDEGIRIWVTSALDEPWQQAASFEPNLGFFASLNEALSDSRIPEDATYVAAGGYLFLVLDHDLYRYDFATGHFDDLKTPRVASLQSRNGALTLSSDGFFSSNRVSFDSGSTWSSYAGYLENAEDDADPMQRQPQRRIKLIGHPLFAGADRAYGIHQARGKNSEPFLVRTDDRGETWQTVPQELPTGCADLELASGDELLLRCFLSGEYYRSNDAGSSWTLEREVSDA